MQLTDVKQLLEGGAAEDDFEPIRPNTAENYRKHSVALKRLESVYSYYWNRIRAMSNVDVDSNTKDVFKRVELRSVATDEIIEQTYIEYLVPTSRGAAVHQILYVHKDDAKTIKIMNTYLQRMKTADDKYKAISAAMDPKIKESTDMKLEMIAEVQEPGDDPFTHSIGPLDEYDTQHKTIKALQWIIQQAATVYFDADRKKQIVQRWRQSRVDPQSGDPVGYKEVTFCLEKLNPTLRANVYIDTQVATPAEVTNLERMAKRSVRAAEKMQEIEKRLKKLHKPAALDYLEKAAKEHEQLSVAQQPKAIHYYDERWRKHWLINPALTYEHPGYSGSPQHNKYHDKAVVTFFELSKFLRDLDFGGFDTVYAGTDDDGAECVIATACHNLMVWEFTASGKSAISTVYIAGCASIRAKHFEHPSDRVNYGSKLLNALAKYRTDNGNPTST